MSVSGSATGAHLNETFALHEGDTLFIPPDTVQSVTNTGSSTLNYLSLLNPVFAGYGNMKKKYYFTGTSNGNIP